MDILIIKTTSLGDVLHSTISLDMIKQTYPNSKIIFMVDKSAYPILKYNKYIDNFIIFDYSFVLKNWFRHPIKTIKYIKSITNKIREIKFDFAFDLQGLFRSVFFLYIAKAEKKYVKGRWVFLNKYKNKTVHAVDEIKNLLSLGGFTANKNTKMHIYTSEKEKEAISKLMLKINPNNKKVIVISPFSRWQSKDWGLKNYFKLIRLIDENDFVLVLTGIPSVKDDIETLLKGYRKGNVYNLSGELTLLEFVELVRKTDLLISSDGFPVHVASACEKPVIALFGATDEKRVKPLSKHSVVLRKQVKCAKCYKRICHNKVCMDNITPEEVLLNIDKLL